VGGGGSKHVAPGPCACTAVKTRHVYRCGGSSSCSRPGRPYKPCLSVRLRVCMSVLAPLVPVPVRRQQAAAHCVDAPAAVAAAVPLASPRGGSTAGRLHRIVHAPGRVSRAHACRGPRAPGGPSLLRAGVRKLGPPPCRVALARPAGRRPVPRASCPVPRARLPLAFLFLLSPDAPFSRRSWRSPRPRPACSQASMLPLFSLPPFDMPVHF